ncbi:unnamed protein product [Brachionus calyciflorus]|uniref:BZIP domain-containing protein n=1 Tax=Brachionus calyciflorus TaxID=104777 RepID=A0A813Y9H7_9BILA|nr:unnamed protein product [Brachionus calyciflorus]
MIIYSKAILPDELVDFSKDLWNKIFERKNCFILGGTIASIILLNFINNWLKQKRLFKKLNIPGPSPLPFIGNLHNLVKQGFADHDINIMTKYGRTVGYFEGSTPVVLTTDVRFIKNVMIKDFNYFVNRRIFDSLLVEPLDKFMTILRDEEWKNVRAIITTAFTTGKLKSMFKHIHECVENLEEFLKNLEEKDGILDTKDLFSCFTLDVISSCCFVFFPKLSGFLSKKELVEFFPIKSFRFFEEFINTVIHRRKNKLELRDDFIQNVLEHEENGLEKNTQETKIEYKDEKVNNKWNTPLKKTLTNKEILSQSILFLLAGYETTAQTLSYIAYNLAMNPNYQDKLIQEVDDVLDRHDGKINYESISEMRFMDNVINETLRMFPPAVRLDRVASADYEYNGIKILKDMVWSVPIWALHHDPEIYPEPDIFRPERFDDKEKNLRESVAFLPFGAGPRNCVGMRFALLEIKTLLASVLSKYSFEKCDKTPEKIQIDNSGFARPTCPLIVKVNLSKITFSNFNPQIFNTTDLAYNPTDTISQATFDASCQLENSFYPQSFKSTMISNNNEDMFCLKSANSDTDYTNLFRGLSTFELDRLNSITGVKAEIVGLEDQPNQMNEKTYTDLSDLVLEQQNIKSDIQDKNLKYPVQVNPILTNSNILNQQVLLINDNSMSSESSYATSSGFSSMENFNKPKAEIKRLGTNKNTPSQSGVTEKPKRGRKPTPLNQDPNVKLTKKQLLMKNSEKPVVCFGNKVVEKNTDEYTKRRESNNEAVKKCRQKLLEKQKEREDRMKKLQDENKVLTNTVDKLSQELNVLKNIIIQMSPDKKLPAQITNMYMEVEHFK